MKQSGEYSGRKCLKLLNHTSEKKKKLSLGDYLCRKDEGQFDMVEFPDDKFSVVKLYEHIEKHFFLPREMNIEVGRFFRRPACVKEMKVCACLFLMIIYTICIILGSKKRRTIIYGWVSWQ